MKLRNHIVAFMMLSLVLAGCGGGGTTADSGGATADSGATPSTGTVLRWQPPQSYADQTPLDPSVDLKEYMIYVNETGVFSDTDESFAVLAAVDPATGSLVTSFNLANLSTSLNPNTTYYISMQAVTNSGVCSGFSPAASFTL